ncbi:MAG: DUF692 family protein, partial [Gemmatimonadota bacterium]|nr:DUF692 family protein [Gemmatimonadota bacterium]
MRAGVAFRPELAPWLATRPGEVRCLELSVDEALTASRTSRGGRIRRLPTALHAPQMAVLTPGPLDPADLERVVRSVRTVDPTWISVYLGCRRRPEAELSYPQPVSLSGAALGQAIANCRRLIDAGARPLLVENVTAFGIGDGSASPAQFLNQLCEESGCGLLLDVTALTVDARFGFDPRRWLWDVDRSRVAAMHLGGRTQRGVGWWAGRRGGHVSEEAWTLARELADRTPVGTAILQRDGRYS